MFSRRIISLIVVLSFVSQAFVVVDTDNSSNLVEDSSPLEQVLEYGAPRSGHHEIENATLLKDINPEYSPPWSVGGSNPHNQFTHTDGNLYWSATNNTSPYNYELWTSDGTEDGTYMVKDINPEGSSSPSNFASMGDILFFAADNGTSGRELWRTDGTEEGTYMIKDICTIEALNGCDGIPYYSTHAGNLPISVNDEFILFQAKNGSYNEELWRSDGTENGTYMVKDINTFEDDGSNPRYFRPLGDGKVIFCACGYDNACHDRELWITDGTEEGTQLLKEIKPGDEGGDPHWFTMLDGVYYFVAEDGSYERELWRTDGTTNGTYRLTALGTTGSQPGIFGYALPFRDYLVFEGFQAYPDEKQLYKYNPSTNETTLFLEYEWDSDAYDPRLKFVVNDKLVFQLLCEGYCSELWVTDGTEEGTSFLFENTLDYDRHINSPMEGQNQPGPLQDTFYPHWDNVGLFTVGNNKHDGLWATDGTTNGTYRITYNLTHIDDAFIAGGNLFFSAHDCQSWGSDGYCDSRIYGEEMHVIRNFTTTAYYTLYKDKVIDPITFDYDGEDADWEIYPDLPASLSFNSEDGTITGTPDELFDFTSYTIYANASIPSTPPDSILYYNVGDDDDGDGYWEDIHGNDDYDIEITNLERVEVTGNTDLTHAYRFDSSSDSAVMGDNFQDWSGDLTDDSISIEMWFKPSALSGNKILWEIGGASDGNSLVLMGDELTYRLKTSGDDNAYVDISTTISLDSEFHNAVVVLDEDAEMAYLYYDGELEASASFSGDFDWGGNNKAGIGGENDNVGGYTNSEQTEYFDGDTTFRGDIAIHRILEDALDSSEVGALYDQFTSYRFKETYKIKIKSVQYPDTDGDGVCDGSAGVSGICTAGPDAFPFDAAASVDTDGDGMPDTLNGESTSEPPLVEDLDDDNDGLLDLDEIANGTDPLDPDTDGDGYCDGLGTVGSCIAGDVFPLDENEWFDTDGDGIGNNADTDDDNDGLDDTTEASSDPATNPTNPDTDGDGVCDGSVNVTINDSQICIGGPDELPTDPDETIDTDGDGIGNNADTDDDGDGLSDDEENEIGTNPLVPDTDGDFYCDGPIVVAGCAGSDDAFPLDDSEWLDTDGDGIGNNADTDDDGDSYDDIWENDNGYDPLDGCDPNLNSSTCDQDKDGLNNGEEIIIGTNETNPDTDGDGFCDGDKGVEGICVAGPDDFPLDPAAHLDTDGDGMPDTLNGTSTSEPALIEDLDDDNDGLSDLDEIANGTDSLKQDSDGDGYCDGHVSITNVCDATDAFPIDATEWVDTDGDGTGNNADTDDDNDGLDDATEASSDPATNSTNPDTDGDGYCDGPVNITDVCDATDAFPTDETEWLDTDDDGTGNNADTDDDGDGYNDTMETSEGSDPLDSESIPLDTDGDKIPDSIDTDDDGDGYNDTEDVFPTNSAEWLDTDDDGIGNNEDTDDDNDTIPDNWDPNPLDPDGDADGDGLLDSEEYSPDSEGNPADSDGDGTNDMLQGVASTSGSSNSDTNWPCWILLLFLLLLIPLLKRQYDNALIYGPAHVDYTIDDNDAKIRMVPSLHEYAKNYRNFRGYEDLRDVTYGISGNLVEGLEIDSKTGVISGHPKKVGEYKYEIVMKHSDGKFKGEVSIHVSEKKEDTEKEEEEPKIVATSNPEPENTVSKPKFEGGAGTKMDPFVITPAKGLEPGEEISSKQVITISGLESGGIVNMEDLDSKDNGKRFAIVSNLSEEGRQSALVADEDGKIKFRVNFKDDKPSTDGAEYEGLIKLGTASVYLSWAVDVAKEESEEEPEPAEEVPLTKEEKKEKELERVKARSEKIDFEVLGQATRSTLSKPVEKDASEIDLEDASDFEKKGTATITDADGSEIITWKSKKGNQLVGIGGLTRAFVAASIVVAKDDLQTIKGIGPFIEEKLNALGIYMFVQIARMTPELEEEVNVAIEFFPGRVKRDEWVKQAKELTK